MTLKHRTAKEMNSNKSQSACIFYWYVRNKINNIKHMRKGGDQKGNMENLHWLNKNNRRSLGRSWRKKQKFNGVAHRKYELK